ncbi:MAG: potassium transporter [Aureispira sp.]|nr:potassium transporter [Aureispira sp.]
MGFLGNTFRRRRGQRAPDDAANSNFNDLGFGTKINSPTRLINKDGSFNIRRTGKRFEQLHIYQWLVLMSWPKFLGLVFSFYILINSIFACLYLAVGVESLSGVATDETMHPFWGAFFFSVQTLTTVGYGSVSPIGFAANLLAAFGAFTGLLAFALATGLLFARFSKPSVSILYSKNALLSPYLEGKGLMFRITNRRNNVLANLHATVMASWIAPTPDGPKRKYSPLALERDHLAFLALNWTIVHPITKESPFDGWGQDDYQKADLEILVVLEGYDETFANIVRSLSSYKWSDLVCNAKFDPMYNPNQEGEIMLDLGKLNDYHLL